jgi:hypothetical protein
MHLKAAKALSAGLALAGVVVSPAASAASVKEYQVAWEIAPIRTAESDLWVRPGNEIFRAKLIPTKLFRPKGEIRSFDGVLLLLGPGNQLVEMDYSKPMVCTLERGPEGTQSFSNRVCLLDDNRDGRFESYFLTGLGKALLTSDFMWFAMNAKIGRSFKALGDVKLQEIDKNLLENSPNLILKYISISDGSQRISLQAYIERFGPFQAFCDAYVAEGNVRLAEHPKCDFPGAEVRLTGREGEALRFRVQNNQSPTNIRFSASYGIVDRRITGFSFFR